MILIALITLIILIALITLIILVALITLIILVALITQINHSNSSNKPNNSNSSNNPIITRLAARRKSLRRNEALFEYIRTILVARVYKGYLGYSSN
jgi:hypothetical protein